MKKKISAIVGMTMLSATLLLTGCGDIGRKVTVGSGDGEKKTEDEAEKKTTKKSSEEETTKKSKNSKETEEEETTRKSKKSEKETEEEETTKKSAKKETEAATEKTKKTSDITVEAPAGWSKVEKSGYSFYIDESRWKESNVAGTDISFLYQDADMFAENINIMTQDTGMYGLDLEGYKDLSVEQYNQIGYDVEEISPQTINGADGYYALVTTEMNSIKICILQWFTLIDDEAYIFTFAADEAGYEKLSSEVMDIFSTVVFE